MKTAFFFAGLLLLGAVSSDASNLVFRNYFIYNLKNNTKTNTDKVTSLLKSLLKSVTNKPVSSAFGPDLGLQPQLGYSSMNAHYGGWVDFKTVASMTAYFKELAVSSIFSQLKALQSSSVRVQSVHYQGDEPLYGNTSTTIRAIFAYYWSKPNITNLQDADRVIADVGARGPYSPPSEYLEIDLNLHDTLYPANPPNFQFVGLLTFKDVPSMKKFYPWSANQTDRNAIVKGVTNTTRIQFSLTGNGWTSM